MILKSASKNIVQLIIILIATCGIIVMYGWAINSSKIVQIHPNLTPMQFNTAFCFFISSLSIILLFKNNKTTIKISKFLNYTVAVICVATLIEYLLSVNFGIDEFFLKHNISTNTFYIGRMAPDTAISFIIFSHVLSITVKNQKQVNLHTVYSFLIFLLGFLNLLAYIFNLESFVKLSNLTQMALHTSICFILLGIALLIYYKKIIKLNESNTDLYFPWKRYAISTTILLLFLDIRFPIGIATGAQYLILIFFGWYIANKKAQITLAISSTFCILIGHYLNNQNNFLNHALSSRVFSIIIIWIITYFLIDLIKKNKKILQYNYLLNEKILELEIKNNKLQQFNFISSHDLQEPLSSIIGFSDILINKHSKELGASSLKSLEYIKNSAVKMQSLMKKLLEYSLIGDMVEIEKVNCNKLLKGIEENFELKLNEINGKLIHNNLPIINASKIEIQLLFQNLIANSIKFAKKDTNLVVEIIAESQKDYWYFKVIDNGIGINKKDLVNIFNIFKRLNKKSDYKGFGIGLANCKKYVELHKGVIWASSELNIGTTIHFTIKKKL